MLGSSSKIRLSLAEIIYDKIEKLKSEKEKDW